MADMVRDSPLSGKFACTLSGALKKTKPVPIIVSILGSGCDSLSPQAVFWAIQHQVDSSCRSPGWGYPLALLLLPLRVFRGASGAAFYCPCFLSEPARSRSVQEMNSGLANATGGGEIFATHPFHAAVGTCPGNSVPPCRPGAYVALPEYRIKKRLPPTMHGLS